MPSSFECSLRRYDGEYQAINFEMCSQGEEENPDEGEEDSKGRTSRPSKGVSTGARACQCAFTFLITYCIFHSVIFPESVVLFNSKTLLISNIFRPETRNGLR